MGEKTIVDGIECMGFQGRWPSGLDTDPATLSRCPLCGYQAAYQERRCQPEEMPIRVVCINSSCAIATPWHYRTRETAAAAWNRRISA